MIKFKTITIRNFMAYGNGTSIVNLDRNGTTLIKGENLDNTTEGVGSNGVGKSTIMNALSYVLFDKTVSQISKDKLINNINNKEMLVTVDFEKNGVHYHIERGRKYKGQANYIHIEENGNPTAPQKANEYIEQILGLTHDLFTRIVVFSAINKSFLELPTARSASGATQIEMIEHLFGMTLLGQKAEHLTKLIKDTKDRIDGENVHIEHITKEQQRYEEQLKNTQKRIDDWDIKHKEDLEKLKNTLNDIDQIDFNVQNKLFDELESIISKVKELDFSIKEINTTIENNEKQLQQIISTKKRLSDWDINHESTVKKITDDLEKISLVDIEVQLTLFSELESVVTSISECNKLKKDIVSKIQTLSKELETAKKELAHLSDERCPYCLQDYKAAQDKIVDIKTLIENNTKSIEAHTVDSSELTLALTDLDMQEKSIRSKIVVKSKDELIKMQSNKTSLSTKLLELTNEINPFISTLKDLEKASTLSDVDVKILTDKLNEQKTSIKEFKDSQTEVKSQLIFDKLSDLLDVKNNVSSITEKISEKEKNINPYFSSLEDLKKTKIEDIDYTKMNDLTKLLEHQQFLQKLLTKKDSFIRKTILDKYLPFLNARLQKYINEIGLPHRVEFTNDLSARIVYFNRELEFNMLSHGQQARVNIALSLAFRDVLQQLHTPINVCLFDEVLDEGLDSVGVPMAASLLKRKAKEDNMTLFIISHKQEIETAFENVLTVQMCDGFSQIKEN